MTEIDLNRIGSDEIPVDEDGRLAGDFGCHRCGYNLRGLAPDGVCPECRTPAGRSLRGDLLRFADPRWVERLAKGTNWLIVSILAGIVLGCASGLATDALAQLALGLTTASITLVGYWLVTERDPALANQPEGRLSARRLARAGAVAGLISPFVSAFLDSPQLVGSAALRPLGMVALGLASILGLIGFFALIVHARRLSMRIPDPKLARNTVIVMSGLVFGYGLVALMGMLAIAAVTTTAGAPGGPMFGAIGAGVLVAAGIIAALFVLVFGVLSILLLIRYRTAFAQQATLARETWFLDAMGIESVEND
ncbi:MAG: hypothetical protein ACF8PN_13925 [Phycisphaerales bacterium]